MNGLPHDFSVLQCDLGLGHGTADEAMNGLEPEQKPATMLSSEVVKTEKPLWPLQSSFNPLLRFHYSRRKLSHGHSNTSGFSDSLLGG